MAGPVTTIAELPEASGLAVGRRVPGRLWSHNDSGAPVVHALDAQGTVTGAVHLTGAAVGDWEAIAVGPCGTASCLYVGDIGDNDAERPHVTVYRVPEPTGAESSVPVRETFHATYPDGAHDAETLLVAPDGGLYIVTKGDTGPVALYRFPKALRPGATHRLERVGEPRDAEKPAANARITDGGFSPDGAWVVLRTPRRLSFHRASELLSGNWREAHRFDLRAVDEAQGEGVAVAAGGTVYLAGEGGGKSRPGTFARLTCPVER